MRTALDRSRFSSVAAGPSPTARAVSDLSTIPDNPGPEISEPALPSQPPPRPEVPGSSSEPAWPEGQPELPQIPSPVPEPTLPTAQPDLPEVSEPDPPSF